ncbi:chalcone isomerase [Aquimarina atlantica]|uniref:Chalcone isomerase n=1 Tax=Aquimarina atlantica TaxID=1317122 RepID=A0A023BVK4_9FLAO|nr:chalcone isomerase family protein [Aquimarina atlantica]EZH73843.1 chalcone isomerase [Aquimarina atlantica]
MKKLSILFIALLTIVSVQSQTKIGDATLPNTVKFNGEDLTINGGGLREKFFFDIYAGALYLKKKSTNASAIAKADETMAIKLHILSGMMSRSKMANALREGFEKSTKGNMKPYNERIEKFIGFINNEIEVGQIYDMVYEKGKGSVIYKDGKEKGYVTGLDFKTALFNIWLGSKPADKGLKKEMLGL